MLILWDSCFFVVLFLQHAIEAGRLKSKYRISLADSIALAEALILGGELLTCDHHEFDVIKKKEPINFMWIR